MAYISNLKTTDDGRRYWVIRVSRGRDASRIESRFYWPENEKTGRAYSEAVALNKLNKYAADFENRVKAGEVVSRKEQKEREAEAEAAAAAERAKLKTVKEYAEGVYMARKNLELAETTRASYQMILDKYIYPEIGDCLISDVSAARLQKMLLDFQTSGKSVSYAKSMYIILNGIFTAAFRDDTIQSLPMLKVDKPKQTKDKVERSEIEKALTLEELQHVLQCVKGEALKWQAYIYLSADTGARRGELCGLQWSDVDTKTNTITIRQNLQYTPQKGVYVSTPKNGKKRYVDIGADTAALLDALKAANSETDENGVTIFPLWVFQQEGTTEPMHPDSPTRYFKKFGEKYGLPGFHPHLLRHTSASLAITEGGADVVSVSERLGHSDTAITLRMYSHASTESIRRAGQGVRDALARLKPAAASEN